MLKMKEVGSTLVSPGPESLGRLFQKEVVEVEDENHRIKPFTSGEGLECSESLRTDYEGRGKSCNPTQTTVGQRKRDYR